MFLEAQYFPPIQAVIHDHANVNTSFIVPLISYLVVLFYGLIGSKCIKYVDEDLTDRKPKSISNKDIFLDDRLKNTLQM